MPSTKRSPLSVQMELLRKEIVPITKSLGYYTAALNEKNAQILAVQAIDDQNQPTLLSDY
ncbi:hypothetical protein [Nostoc sp. ChiVER01]|uniref:hypothetical protein n=1 Tax=Nostoc sp. ChiVER01 TaxID=3075382 RepID=UPI002AD2919A|nr:hypothetical protein [Nostoc sp. ChiVER01]MDZ8227568.1 hypothetical protein [Nostoc sp. ChiVER01]